MIERGRQIQRVDDSFKLKLLLGSSSVTGTEEQEREGGRPSYSHASTHAHVHTQITPPFKLP